MGLKLIKLSEDYKDRLIEMFEEWKADIERNHTNGSPWAIFKNDCHDFNFYLSNLDLKENNGKYVPDSTFFLLDEDSGRLLGAANIRHYLNERPLAAGGHIRDGIRPSERGKGYGKELVRLALLECKKLGIKKVLMVCSKDNEASRRTILDNGGILENEIVDDDNETLQRYWIDLSGE